MSKIASDTSAANMAVSGVRSVTVESGGTCSLSQSNISGMEKGVEATNQIQPTVSGLVDCVKMQAAKFPKLAAVIESRDRQTKFQTGGK